MDFNGIDSYVTIGFYTVVRMIPIGIILLLLLRVIVGKKLPYKHLFPFIVYMCGVIRIVGFPNKNKPSLERFIDSTKQLDIPIINANPMMMLLNFFLFVPIGFFLMLLLRDRLKKGWIIVIILALTLSIEIAQGFTGRLMEVDDVLMNTLGGIAGIVLFRIINRIGINGFRLRYLIIFVASCLILIGGFGIYQYNLNAKHDNQKSPYMMELFDSYDEKGKSISQLFSQKDSLQRIEYSGKELEKCFGKRLKEDSFQTLSINGKNYSLWFVSETYLKDLNLEKKIVSGGNISFDYQGRIPALFPRSLEGAYKIGDVIEAPWMGEEMNQTFEVCGFISDKSIQSDNQEISLKETIIVPLYDIDVISEADFSDFAKKVLILESVEGTIKCNSLKECKEIKDEVKKISKKYNIDYVVNDIEEKSLSTLSFVGNIVLMIIGMLVYLIYVFKTTQMETRDVDLKTVKENENKMQISSIVWYVINAGFVYMILKNIYMYYMLRVAVLLLIVFEIIIHFSLRLYRYRTVSV